MSEASSRYNEINNYLCDLFFKIKESIDPLVASEVEEYLENREYGLAVEALATGIVTSEKAISQHLIKLLLHVALQIDIFDDQNIILLNLKIAKEHAVEVAKDNALPRDSYQMPA
jgi:hypothetical protein